MDVHPPHFKRNLSDLDDPLSPPAGENGEGCLLIERQRENRIGDILISNGLLTREQVEKALENRCVKGQRIGDYLIQEKIITEAQLLKALAIKFDMPFVDLSKIAPSPVALASIATSEVLRLRVLPVDANHTRIVVATSRPTDVSIRENLRFHTNKQVELIVSTSEQIEEAIGRWYENSKASLEEILGEIGDAEVTLQEEASDSQVRESDTGIIKLVNQVLVDAYLKRASDIHVEPGRGATPTRIRYRVDGVCQTMTQVPPTHQRALVSRLKIIANLDIAERRRPQSGKIILEYRGQKIEYRVEVTPTIGGIEDLVLRILTTAKPLALDELNFFPENAERFRQAIGRPYGMVLVVGPTGSGKTTTLHSALQHINTDARKIWTAEDPVEITQEGLRQVQVKPKIGFGFQEALRSFLRADPDVIMIGEMRDRETAKTAIEASLTGHLVFSTLHTNSAPEAAARLLEMGVDCFNFADALLGILAQRLLRRLCERCREPYVPTNKELRELVQHYGPGWFKTHQVSQDPSRIRLYRPKGCPACGYSGFKGRLAVHELMTGSERIKQALINRGSAAQIREIALAEGMRTLKMDGIQKALLGLTDMQQVGASCN